MVDAIGDHDVFKLVSLRGSADGTVIDPGNDGIEMAVMRELSGVDLVRPPEEVRAAAAHWQILSAEELANLAWASLPGVSKPEALVDLLSPDVVIGSENVALRAYGAQAAFLASYGQLADSWIGLELKRRWGLVRDAGPLLDGHARLIRVAHVIAALGRNRPTLDRRLVARLANARIILPRGLSRGRTTGGMSAGAAKKQREARRREIAEARRTYVKHATAIAQLESIQHKVAITLGEWGRNRELGDGIALDTAFYEALDRRLTGAERAVLVERTGPGPADRPSFVGDLGSALEVVSDVAAANALCSKIHVFEDEEIEKLPKAQQPQDGERPSVRALGWGDLVVLRERLVGYDAREIAHIENVLAGEDKAREHERLHRTEEMVETETFKETQSERDLQTSDRFELQAEAQKTIDTQFSVEAGVNTSGRYGLTKVSTSLDAGFTRDVSESRRESTQLAKEVVTRSIEKVQESVRELRRTLTIDQIRELSRHSISNTASGPEGQPPQHRVGIYCWVEKIHQLELRHYGTRLMVEFHIPEPGLTLLEQGKAPRPSKRKPADLAFGPQDISAANYLCLTQRYGARDVEPPPPLIIQTGMAWASEVSEEASDAKAEDAVAATVKIPPGYAPISGHALVTGRGWTESIPDKIYVQVSVGGKKVIEGDVLPDASYHKPFSFDDAWPVNPNSEGLPVSIRIAGHDDRTATVNLALACRRSDQVYQAWQLRTFEKIRDAHALLVREYEEALEKATFAQATLADISGRPEAQNRQIERDELAKWAIKTMRVDPFDFDAVVDEDGIQEVDPIASDQQALAVRFFQEAFEWREMSYFLYPYFWGRRSAWALRNAIQVGADPQHEAFLRSGAARVIVPVTPGYEDRVLQYLDSDVTLPELERIPPPTDTEPEGNSYHDFWVELLVNRNEELALGSGTLSVTHGDVQVVIGADSQWRASERDLGREIHIGGARYQVAAFDPSGTSFSLDRPYEGPTEPAARYAAGSVPFDAPWLVRIPTALVVLSNKNADDIIAS